MIVCVVRAVVLCLVGALVAFFAGGMLSPLESPREHALKTELATTHASVASTILALREKTVGLEQQNAELEQENREFMDALAYIIQQAREVILQWVNVVELMDGRMELMAARIERIAAMANEARNAPGNGSPWAAFKRFSDARDDADHEAAYQLYETRLRRCLSLEEFTVLLGVIAPRARGTVFFGQSIAPGGVEATVVYDDGTPYGGGPQTFLLKEERGRWVIPLPNEVESRCAEAAANIQRFS